jgi:hypothetical protein
MKRWHAKLPAWELALAWLALIFVAAVAYFFPIARLVGALAE